MSSRLHTRLIILSAASNTLASSGSRSPDGAGQNDAGILEAWVAELDDQISLVTDPDGRAAVLS